MHIFDVGHASNQVIALVPSDKHFLCGWTIVTHLRNTSTCHPILAHSPLTTIEVSGLPSLTEASLHGISPELDTSRAGRNKFTSGRAEISFIFFTVRDTISMAVSRGGSKHRSSKLVCSMMTRF